MHKKTQAQHDADEADDLSQLRSEPLEEIPV